MPVNGEFFKDFLVRFGVPYVAGVWPFADARLSGVIAVLRTARQGPFGEPELSLLGRLSPHFRRAVQLQFRLQGAALQRLSIEAALERLPFGVVIADAGGRVLLANPAARDMAAAADGLLIRDGRLGTAHPPATAALLRLIGEATTAASQHRGAGGTLSVPRPSGRRSWAILVAPLGPHTTRLAPPHAPAAVVLIHDLEQPPHLLGPRLVELCGLTPGEARLAVALAGAGGSRRSRASAACACRRCAPSCAPFSARPAPTRQAELTALLARLPALRSDPEARLRSPAPPTDTRAAEAICR